MFSRKPTAPLTDKKHEPFLGTLTPKTWKGLAVEAIAADWFDISNLDTDFEKLRKCNPTKQLVQEARLSSGSIHGGHRHDITKALVGANPVMGMPLSSDRDDAPPEDSGEPM